MDGEYFVPEISINIIAFLLQLIIGLVTIQHLSKMKFLIVVLAVLGVGYAIPASRSLQEDLQQIVDLIPVDEIREIARRYNENDAEFQQVVAYLQGEEWAALVAAARDNETWQRFKVFMEANGIDIEGLLDAIRDIIANARVAQKSNGQRSIRDFVDEVRAIIPLDEILVTLNNLLTNSADFQEFYAAISGEESRQLVDDVSALPEVQRIAQVLRDMGINVDGALEFIFGLLGWE
ncbi:Insect allergen related repeat, nitrile-specifier detoxification [Popillia japonica]|uniref:Insect allergen related repeat, nitrile-specifier detoxification n=1 Tax=Popillia japonica TaxID=7064 RepID=A0AAW1IX89_POPJA